MNSWETKLYGIKENVKFCKTKYYNSAENVRSYKTILEPSRNWKVVKQNAATQRKMWPKCDKYLYVCENGWGLLARIDVTFSV